MQYPSLKKIIGTFMLLYGLMAAPVISYASASATAVDFVTPEDDTMRMFEAEMGTVASNIIEAIMRFGKAAETYWIFATTSDMRVDDNLNVFGTLTPMNVWPAFNLAVSRIINATSTKNGLLDMMRDDNGLLQN